MEKSVLTLKICSEKVGEKVEIGLEGHRQILEETKRIKKAVQFRSRTQHKTQKSANSTRI